MMQHYPGHDDISARTIARIVILLLLLLLVAFLLSMRSAGDPPSNDERIKHGEEVFTKNCNRCHPGGEKGKGPRIISKPNFVKKYQVRHGSDAMPAFSKMEISKTELKDLLLYLKKLRKDSKKKAG